MYKKSPAVHPFKIFVYERHELVAELDVTELPVIIGRHSQVDLSLKGYRWLSRQHAAVQFENGRYLVRELRSKEGLQYQGRYVSVVEIIDGTRLSIGSLDFLFEFVEGEGQTASYVAETPAPPPEKDANLEESAQTIVPRGATSHSGKAGGKSRSQKSSSKERARPSITLAKKGSDETIEPLHMKVPKKSKTD